MGYNSKLWLRLEQSDCVFDHGKILLMAHYSSFSAVAATDTATLDILYYPMICVFVVALSPLNFSLTNCSPGLGQSLQTLTTYFLGLSISIHSCV